MSGSPSNRTEAFQSDPIAALLHNYASLNAKIIDEIHEDEPSALEFMRYSARNRPFVARQAARKWTAVEKWSATYLRDVMGEEKVQVAVTPYGNADAVVVDDGNALFVEPYETTEPFSAVLDYIQEDSRIMSEKPSLALSKRAVKYAQTQNDNLRHEYAQLFQDVPKDVAFARIALDTGADAINLWLGNDRSVTSLHKDNYENIYVQVRGQKHFCLLPPIAMPCVNERELLRARYVTHGDNFGIEIVDPEQTVPVATWDPDSGSLGHPLPPSTSTATPYSHLVEPIRVTLQEGDMLYLPSLWYHKVSQTVGAEGFVCAVNYWYDLDFSGQFWATNAFVRDVYHSSRSL